MVPPAPHSVSDVVAQADAAAARAGVEVRTLHDVAGQAQACAVVDAVWPTVGGGTQLTPNLVRAVEHAGGYVAAAFDVRPGADPRNAIGMGFGFLGQAPGDDGEPMPLLHSHMAAVLDGYRDRHIGTAIKAHQRAWAARHGIPVITWTFDPLVRRNVRFNLVKLGATVREYLVDFYGAMEDELNAGLPSDRLLAWWEVGSARAHAAAEGRLAAYREPPADSVVVPLPADIHDVLAADPAAAGRWRVRVREAVLAAMADGMVIDGVMADGAIVLRAGQEDR